MGLERQAVNLFFLFYYKCEIKFVLNIGSDFQLTFLPCHAINIHYLLQSI